MNKIQKAIIVIGCLILILVVYISFESDRHVESIDQGIDQEVSDMVSRGGLIAERLWTNRVEFDDLTFLEQKYFLVNQIHLGFILFEEVEHEVLDYYDISFEMFESREKEVVTETEDFNIQRALVLGITTIVVTIALAFAFK